MPAFGQPTLFHRVSMDTSDSHSSPCVEMGMVSPVTSFDCARSFPANQKD